jgi:hypothetical protein
VRFAPLVARSFVTWRTQLRAAWPILAAVELLSLVASQFTGNFPLDSEAPISPGWLVFTLLVVLPASLIGEGTCLGLYGGQGERGIGAALRHGSRQIGSLLIYYFLLGVFLTALALPVLITWRLQQRIALVVGAAMGAFALWLLGRWFLAPALIAVHGYPAASSFRKSAALLGGRTITAVGLNLLFLGLTFLPQLLSFALTAGITANSQDPGAPFPLVDALLAVTAAPLAFALLCAARVTLAQAVGAEQDRD